MRKQDRDRDRVLHPKQIEDFTEKYNIGIRGKHIRRKLKRKNSSIIREVNKNNQTSEKSEKRVADARDAADEEESKNANSILSQSADDVVKKIKQASRRVTYK